VCSSDLPAPGWRPALGIFLLLGVYLIYGFVSLRTSHGRPSPGIRIAVLQGNIEQNMKWNELYRERIMDVYGSLVSRAKKEFNPDIILWPESSVPGYVLSSELLQRWMKRLIDESRCYHLVGAVSYSEKKFYNCIMLFSPDAVMSNSYAKMHLVPFGETVPLKSFLSKYIKTLNELGDFSPGRNYSIFRLPYAPIVGNVCFESIFPYISRNLTKNGAQILVNVTNDGWYLKTSAPYQHFMFNIFRAVENRRMLVRSANTGISGLIDENGRVVSRSAIFEELYLGVTVRPNSRITFYTRFGDFFVLLCFIVSASGLVLWKQHK
jgi:apolipoprotein N-acyltransferase